VVGRAAALLTPRVAAFAGLAALLGVYYAESDALWSAGVWWDVAWVSCVLIPAVFALVYLALPLRRHGTELLVATAGLVALTAILAVAGADPAADFGKLAAATLLAFWFVQFFESALWVALLAVIVPWVDAYSVWRGPTGSIVKHHPQVFTSLSFAFPVPGEHEAARLGPPDLLFFAFFLAAAAQFHLRTAATWVAMVALLGATIAITVWLDLSGLPALPALAVGFLVANGDLLWRRFRARRA
jgi:hypothetical protein